MIDNEQHLLGIVEGCSSKTSLLFTRPAETSCEQPMPTARWCMVYSPGDIDNGECVFTNDGCWWAMMVMI